MTTDAPAPRANPDLVGQGAAEQALLSAWGSGRMPHAWLIGGPRGIGKATLAFRFARFALAGGGEATGGLFGDDAAPGSLALSPTHPVFRRVAAGGHCDLLTVERRINPDTEKLRGEIVVEDVRDVASFLHLTPVEGGWRVVVVDAADEMNPNAANALLKVLEEPPAQALLLLVSHAPGKLLPTIRSRCRQLAVPPLEPSDVAMLVARFRPELPGDDQASLVALAEGSIGRALDLCDRGGVELYRELLGLLARAPELDVPAVHEFADRLGRGSDEASGFRTAIDLLSGWSARLAKTAAGAPPPTEIIAGETAFARRLAGAATLDRWIAVWDKIARLAGRTESANLDRKQVLLNAVLEIAETTRA
jgi:DNA polymerase-3 subunit delta'